MPEKIRCPNCGALNAAGAEWCNQCLTVFRAPESDPEPEPAPVQIAPVPPVPFAPAPGAPAGSDIALAPDPETASPGAASAAVSTTPAAIPATALGTRGAFTVTEAGITWTCAVCDSVNPIDAAICLVCNTPFAETVREKPERIQRDPNTAALISLFMPGAGHAYIGQWGQATARAIVSLWTLLVVTIAIFSKDQPGSTPIALIFGFASVALWAITAHDAYREARNEPQQVLLKGRVFLYLVLGLLTLLMGLLMATSLSQ
ncbi:MAG: hypothetical protein QOK47_1623, partial [Actinomycetota bacterium]|nr:hypothetical protein [Actinomycetota bacterium]